ncbi:MAG: succinate dehydrogenase cytochrome b subunit [Opitutaceae bacterium]|nr:succinate dehydrogenase cytochrome b subunit [Opitutaceae bacterium]
MSLFANLFCSSIGRKILMALTGLILVGFAFGHLVGNLQIFSHPDKINGYAVFLHQTGPLLWVARIGLLAAVGIHIWAATMLTLENKRARGPEAYAVKTWIRATMASRYIRWTGYVVLAFIIYHLAHFTLGSTHPEDFKDQYPYVLTHDYTVLGFKAVAAGSEVPNVYLMVYRGFESAPVAIFYMIAVGLLSLHLLHGVDSLFQTLGLRSATWSNCLRRVVALLCIAYFLGNLAIPGAILTGVLQPHPAAQVHQTANVQN